MMHHWTKVKERSITMYFLPRHYPALDPFAFFGIAIFLCHFVGEMAFKTKMIPRISGYILLGVLLGPNGLKLINKTLLTDMGILTDISLSLILFSIGRHLDLKWLLNDRGLFFSCLFEFLLTVVGVSLFMYVLKWTLPYALLAGIIAGTTSPAIVLLIAQDLNTEGPISRRTLAMTSANNFFAVCLFGILFPFIGQMEHAPYKAILHGLYRLLGSFTLAFIFFKILEFFTAHVFEKNKKTQFTLLMSVLIIAISVSKNLNLSTFLVLISLGVATRNFDSKHALLEFNFDFLTNFFFMPLFFITGCYLDFTGFSEAPVIVMGYILIRVFTKTSGVFLFRKLSSLTNKQAIFIAGALTPLSSTAIGITAKINHLNPEIGSQLLLVVSSAVAFFGILTPIVVQTIFLKSGEAFDDSKRV